MIDITDHCLLSIRVHFSKINFFPHVQEITFFIIFYYFISDIDHNISLVPEHHNNSLIKQRFLQQQGLNISWMVREFLMMVTSLRHNFNATVYTKYQYAKLSNAFSIWLDEDSRVCSVMSCTRWIQNCLTVLSSFFDTEWFSFTFTRAVGKTYRLIDQEGIQWSRLTASWWFSWDLIFNLFFNKHRF